MITIPHEFAIVLRRDFPYGAPCRIVGDSMEPALFDHDVVLVDTNNCRPRFGEIAVVHLAASGRVVGRWRGATLAKDNPAYDAIKLTPADKILGVVVRVIERDISEKTVGPNWRTDNSWMDAAMMWAEGPKARAFRAGRGKNG